MANQRRYDTPDAIARRLAEGAGSGIGPDYKPYIEVRDIYSQGRRLRCRCTKFGRTLHFFSDLETGCGYYAEWSRSVIGFREQYPLLPLSETIDIAAALGVKHPTHPHSRFPVVMTTDQIWTLENGTEVAINCKYAKDRSRDRNIEKRAIEEEYHKRRGRPLYDHDEESLPPAFSRNWSFLRGYLDPTTTDPQRDLIADEIHANNYEWMISTRPTQQSIIRRIESQGIPSESALPAYYALIARRKWDLDIFSARVGPHFECQLLSE